MKKFLIALVSVLLTGIVGFGIVKAINSNPNTNEEETPPTPPPHTHEFEAEWHIEDFRHWKKCLGCEVHDIQSHDWDNVVVQEPTYKEDGKGENRCKVCGYVNEYRVPMLSHSHEFERVNEEEVECEEEYLEKCKYCGDERGGGAKKHTYVNYECKDCGKDYCSEGITFDRNDAEKKVTVYGGTNEEIASVAYDLPQGYEFIIGWLSGSFSSVRLPDYTTQINTSAFDQCPNLKELVVPDSVKKMGDMYGIPNLEKITLPAGLMSLTERIDNFVRDDIKADKVYCDGTSADVGELVKEFRFETNEIYVKNAQGEFELLECFEYEGDYLPLYTFENMSQFKEVKLKVDKIGYHSFRNCENLEKVEIIANEFEGACFTNCPKLTTVNVKAKYVQGFSDCPSLKNVTIEAEEISFAFNNCDGLAQIHLNVDIIGKNVLQNCEKLEKITLGEYTSFVGENSFSNNPALKYFDSGKGEFIYLSNGVLNAVPNLTDVHINKKHATNVTMIDLKNVKNLTVPMLPSLSSYNATNLVTLKVTNNILSERDSSISNLNKLESVEIVGELFNNTITECNSLKTVKITTSNKKTVSLHDLPELNEYTIEGDVIALPYIKNCPKLTSFVVPEGVTSTESSQYLDVGLKEITLPKTLKEIDNNPFPETLETVYYNGSLMDWNNVDLYNEKSNPMYYASEFYTLENGEYVLPTVLGDKRSSSGFSYTNVTINDYAFYGFGQLESIGQYVSIETIGKYAFAKSGLKSFEYDYLNDTYIYGYAFDGCKNLTSVKLGTPKSIGSCAFRNCTALKDISISLVQPSGIEDITSLGTNIFYGCTPNTNSYEDGEYIGDTNNPYQLLLTDGIERSKIHPLCLYRAENYWWEKVKDNAIETEYEGITYEGTLVNPYQRAKFVEDKTKTNYTLHSSTQIIGQQLFANCKNLKEVSLPENVTRVEYGAFMNCENLERIALSRAIKKIEADAFKDCKNLKYATVNCNDVLELGYTWFNIEFVNEYSTPMYYALNFGYSGLINGYLETIVVPEGIETLKAYSLIRFKTGQTTLKLPSTLKEIEDGAVNSLIHRFKEVHFAGDVYDWISLNCGEFLCHYSKGDTKLYIAGEELKSLTLDCSKDVRIDPRIFYTCSLESLTIKGETTFAKNPSDSFIRLDGRDWTNLKNVYVYAENVGFYDVIHISNLELERLFISGNVKISYDSNVTIKTLEFRNVSEVDLGAIQIETLKITNTLGAVRCGGIYVYYAKNVEISAKNVCFSRSSNIETVKIQAENLAYVGDLAMSTLKSAEITCRYYEGSTYNYNNPKINIQESSEQAS